MEPKNEFANLEESQLIEMPGYSLKPLKDGEELVIKVLCDPHNEPDMDHKTGEQKLDRDKKPSTMDLMHVVDSNGVDGEMVLPYIVNRAMEKSAAHDPATGKPGSVVGRFFKMKKVKSESGKTTTWRVAEMVRKAS